MTFVTSQVTKMYTPPRIYDMRVIKTESVKMEAVGYSRKKTWF